MPRKRKDPPNTKLRGGTYYENFSVAGVGRFRGSLETADPQEAADRALSRKNRAIDIRDGRVKEEVREREVTLDEAVSSYLKNIEDQSSYGQRFTWGAMYLKHFGKPTPLHTLTTSGVLNFKMAELKHLHGDSLNNVLYFLATAIRWMQRIHKVRVPDINFRELFEPKRKPSTRVLFTGEQEQILRAALDDEHFKRIFNFGVLTGLRVSNLINLTWDEVDYPVPNKITLVQKGDRIHDVDICAGERAILDACRGHHETYVFTFMAKVEQHRTHLGVRIIRKPAERYPWTISGLQTRWYEIRAAAGLRANISWHRATRGTHCTRALKLADGNFRAAMKSSGHTTLANFMRYIGVDDTDVIAMKQRRDAELTHGGHTPGGRKLKVVSG